MHERRIMFPWRMSLRQEVTMDEQSRKYRACERKKRYDTRVDARKAAERSSRRKDAPKIFVYECPYCGGWHLTHRRPGR